MPISGKYDFKGIQNTGRLAIKAALASNPSTAWLNKFGFFTDLLIDFGINWLANKGLIFLNVGAFYVGGELDQKSLDNAIERGLAAVENPNIKLTPEQMKEIDDAVIRAADKALPYGSKPTKPTKPPKSTKP